MATPTESPDLPDLSKLWDYSAPAETEKKFRDLLPKAEVSADRSYHLQLLTQIARAQGLQNQFDKAHATLDEVERQLGPGLELARIRMLLERGRAFNSAGERAKAMPLFMAAYELAATTTHIRHTIDAVHMVAIAAPDANERVLWNLKAIEMVNANPGERGWLVALYNNLGEAYRALNEFDKALDVFQKLIALEKELGREPWLYTYVDEAKMLRLLGRCDQSLQNMRRLEDVLKKKGKRDGFVSEEIGECLLAQGAGDQALPYLREAFEELSKLDWMVKSEPERLERLRDLTQKEIA